ncbi:tetratricopeptide repeat-containing sensor histidine kinase [Fulvivirga ulvae]|uniref:tetratricopeptide repeat-containing sensor histidine kinase n=1 Tax=Fulvivirga ulvae TaxID=2904245 RepID=UPI001F1E0427|nr:ATP-binding protein [Fulvivirga ulvae]UII32389.1 tetratricopeptide repeat-containing sensor histidine kinase [Fulvivirga ulvae]
MISAQDQHKADSLINLMNNGKIMPDSTKFEVLRGIFINQTDPDLKLHYAYKAYKMAVEADNLLWLYKSTLNIGHAHKKKGDLQKALDALLKSLEFAGEMKDGGREAIAYSAIGSVYRVQGNFTLSLKYYNLAIIKLREKKDYRNLAKSLMNTGELYRVNHQMDSALIYFTEAGELFDKINYRIGKAYNLGNIGLIYAEQGKNALAEQNINEAVRILKELGDIYAISVYDTYMADIYKDKGDYIRALEYANRSHMEAVKGGLKEQIRDASLKLSELYSDLKDYERAFGFQSQYIVYRDSINNEATIRKMADLRTEFEVSQKQAEVDLLNEQKRNQQIIGIGLTIVILLVGALAFMFYKNSKQRQHTNQILSEQKEEIEAQRDQLDELNQSKDKFFSIISHDLRGPVHAFKGMSRLIKMYIDQNCIDELAELNQHFDKSVDQLSTLLDDLLDWAVSQQGKVPYSPEEVSLHDLSEDIMGLFHNMAQAKKINLTTSIPEDIQLWVDSNSLRTILRNLVNNALKFTEEGGSVTLFAGKDGDMAALHVADTGRGIPQVQLESLFKLGGHKRSWGTEGEKGLGLGLQLVYSFSEMNGGSITVESEEGVGTTFTIHMPLFQPTPIPDAMAPSPA